jgi:hypothetical protein
MAAILDNNNEFTYVSFPIIKVDKTDDGDLLVWGRATDGSVDHDQQIVDPEWSGKALETWLKTGGNVRVMHSTQHLPAGKGVEIAKSDGDGDGHWVRSLVVEPTAKRLVEKGVLQAYSVGISSPRIVRDRLAKGGRIVGGEIHELSLVDRPANKNCGITLVKSLGGNAEEVEELFGMDTLYKKKKDKPNAAEDASEDSSYRDEVDDTDAEDEPDAPDDGSDGEPDDEPDEDVKKSQYLAARTAWLDREPAHDANPAPVSGTAFLAKRAAQDAWTRWDAEGEAYGLDGTEAGYEKWLVKRAADEPVDVDVDVAKSAKGCPKCGAEHHADSKLRKCDKCGAKLPRADKGFVPFKKKPKPDTSLDVDADEPDGDEDVEKASYAVKRMHDATCAAYHWDAVVDEYPSLKGVADAIVPSFFLDQVSAAALKGDMVAVQSLAGVAQAADELSKGVIEPEKLADARAWLHKGFTDLYPTQGPLTPTTMSAGRFQRPYISAGRAPLNAPASRSGGIPQGTNTPDPDDFQRGYIAAGHAAQSPSNKGNNLDTGGSLASGSVRTFYANASKEAARNALTVLHDHIAGAFPGTCAMAASKGVMPPDMNDTNRPQPVTPPEVPKAPGETVVKTLSEKAVKKIVKSAVADATQAVRDAYEDQIAALEARIDELGAQPDPTQAPLRGVVRKAYDTTAEPVPVERISLVEKAQKRALSERDEEVAYIQANFLNHPNPRLREQGEARLRQLLDS